MSKLKLDESLNRLKHLFSFKINESNEINEVDWENQFSDVKKTCLSPESVVEMLNTLKALKVKWPWPGPIFRSSAFRWQRCAGQSVRIHRCPCKSPVGRTFQSWR